MEPYLPKKIRATPEAIIQEAIIKKLRYHEWFVKPTHGNAIQFGFPDLYASHWKWGPRWIECKNPVSYKFTPAQLEYFPQFSAARSGIWILTSDSDEEYRKLFKPENWTHYLSIWRGR